MFEKTTLVVQVLVNCYEQPKGYAQWILTSFANLNSLNMSFSPSRNSPIGQSTGIIEGAFICVDKLGLDHAPWLLRGRRVCIVLSSWTYSSGFDSKRRIPNLRYLPDKGYQRTLRRLYIKQHELPLLKRPTWDANLQETQGVNSSSLSIQCCSKLRANPSLQVDTLRLPRT
jgi:hypothetical protein